VKLHDKADNFEFSRFGAKHIGKTYFSCRVQESSILHIQLSYYLPDDLKTRSQ